MTVILNTLAGRYEIIRQLGGGGFAVTFLARDILQPSKPLCVVKQLRPNQSHPRVVEFFEKEAAILEKLGQHPQIPQLLAHFNENENLYIIQEFIEGQDLSQEFIPGAQLSEDNATQLLEDILEVVSFIHSKGVIHRDIKPQNLMRRHEDGRIFLIDFGAVKELGSLIVNSQGEVYSSVVIGTPGYMPNEQKNGKPCLGSDVYAVGMTIIQALTGDLPSDLQEDPLTGEIIWQNQVQVSDHLAQVLTQMVRRHFSLRYSQAAEALQALKLAPTILLNPSAEQIFFQEARSRAKQGQGTFSIFALKILESKRHELGLSEDRAKEIQEEVLQPYREYQQKLQEYEQALIDAVKHQYPFDQTTQKDLQDYQQYLGLHHEDIVAIEERVITQKSPQWKAQIQTELFEFEFATLNVKSDLSKNTRAWIINRIWGRAKFFTENLGNDLVLEMVAIPGGELLMGSPRDEAERYNSESPQHTVTLQPFFMGKYLVTQSQWKAVAALEKVNIQLNPEVSHFKGTNRPVEQVSWDEAVEFCARLAQATGKPYRLPTEAEWEYACRAGTTTPFCVGETITTDLANYNGNYTYASGPKGKYCGQTTDVGIFPANPFGLFDMHGNTWEWCEDSWHKNYKGAPADGSVWMSDNHTRLLRGGSWNMNPWNCRSAVRNCNARDNKYINVGFRVALSLSSN
ncbi:bifunctional serine/threonine-protein kinase/formylglycine-generating enzyme family protein [Calothrix sp. NIES-2098]|uniref:bifunctional serine/threonine-protein kinase/formylglycine-generating enzyme family protein n=1 Tax=Calothrix sp. NIES-2098 TaxID=1954171 RepID=UPI000B618105|nr:serine/threonine protein kinase [Calothrix sp. NIES-2098]